LTVDSPSFSRCKLSVDEASDYRTCSRFSSPSYCGFFAFIWHLGELLTKLADYTRLIEFFGIGAMLVWLYFLDKADKPNADRASQRQIEIITAYYQISWVLFGIAVLAEFSMTQTYLNRAFGHDALSQVNALAVICGLAAFVVPSYYVYTKITEHKNYADLLIPEKSHVFITVGLALMNALMLYGITTSPSQTIVTQGFGLAIVISYIGMFVSFTNWIKDTRRNNLICLLMIFLPYISAVIGLSVWFVAKSLGLLG
jgi:hypothetical protein